jgi:hypothetical protein
MEIGRGKELPDLIEYAIKITRIWPSSVGDVGFFADSHLSSNAARAYF